LDVPRHVGQRFMEVDDGGLEVRKFKRPVVSADEESASIPQYVVHMPDQFVWRSDFWRCSK
jgi:hypothetical protein